jgi:hypothetical protein
MTAVSLNLPPYSDLFCKQVSIAISAVFDAVLEGIR